MLPLLLYTKNVKSQNKLDYSIKILYNVHIYYNEGGCYAKNRKSMGLSLARRI